MKFSSIRSDLLTSRPERFPANGKADKNRVHLAALQTGCWD
jgi:hypothetical protein